MSDRRRSQSCEEKRRTRPLEIENRIFTIMPRICHWHGQCVALSLSLLSQRRWSLFAAVFVNAHVVWHSVVLHGNVLGTILEHWLPHHVSHCTIVQRSPTLWSIYRIVFFFINFHIPCVCRRWLCHHYSECHLHHLLQHNYRISDCVHCEIDGQHIALDALRQ